MISMFKFHLTHHSLGLKEKPSHNKQLFAKTDFEGKVYHKESNSFMEWGIQSNYMYNNYLVSIEEFFELAVGGHTWRVGYYDLTTGNMKRTSIKHSQILALDFDDVDQTPQELVDLGHSFGIEPNFWYYSFSHGIKPKNNFRLVWVIDTEVTVQSVELAIAALMKLFQGANPDRATKDASRLFYGTNKGGELISVEPIKIEDLKFLEEYLPRKQAHTKDATFTGEEYTYDDAIKVGPTWIEEIAAVCPILKRWVEGERIPYAERFLLWSNLKYIKRADTSKSISEDLMTYYKPESYTTSSFTAAEINSSMNKADFCVPICQVGSLKLTVVDYLQLRVKEPDLKKVPLKVVEDEFTSDFEKYMESDKITSVNVQTGVGKTEQALKFALKKASTHKIVIAAPRYDLIEEIMMRAAQMAPHLTEFFYLPEKSREYDEIDKFNMLHGVSPRRVEQPNRTEPINDLIGVEVVEEKGLFGETVKRKQFFKKNGVYFVSHAALANLREAHTVDYIIIDEDIVHAVEVDRDLDTTNLQNIKAGLEPEHHYLIDNLVDNIGRAAKGTVIKHDDFIKILGDRHTGIFDFNKFRGKLLGTGKGCPGLYDLINEEYTIIKKDGGDFFFHGIKTIIHTLAAAGTKITMLSATSKRTSLELIFGDKVEFIEFEQAENKGKVIWYPGISGAKGLTGTEHVEDYMAYVEEKIGKNIPIITHKQAAAMWEANGFIVPKIEGTDTYYHLRNVEGVDKFKGKELAIVGKSELPMAMYEKFWLKNFPNEEFPGPVVKETYENGVSIKKRVFEDPLLAQFQQEELQSIGTQAAGRARALREEEAIVHYFADVYIKDIDEIKL